MKKVKSIFSGIKWNNKVLFILFASIVIVLSFVYDYHEIINKQPQSVHAWRQSDCASQALNYAERDYNFFKPQIHAQVSESYQSGYCVEELPIIYYIVGSLYKIFGHHEFIYRSLVLLIFFIGLFFLLKLYLKTIKDKFWSLCFTVLLFTSPVFIFYANNYILNIPAFSITLIGWYFFFVYVNSKKQKHLLISILLFTFASLLKISELISVFTILGIFFLDYFKFLKTKENKRIFSKHIIRALYPAASLLIIYFWYLYTHYFNLAYDQHYYCYTIGDYFSLTDKEIDEIIKQIADYWSLYYQNTLALYFYIFTMAINILFINKVNRLFMAIASIMTIGSTLFVLLFFSYLGMHDYYVISLFITTIFSTITFLDLFLNNYPSIINSLRTKIIFVIFLIYCIHYADVKMLRRYHDYDNDVYRYWYKDMYTIKPYLDEIGVGKNDKVISIPDITPNLTLYLMDRPGFSNFMNSNSGDLIKLGIEKGAKYLIITFPSLLSDEQIKPYLYHKVGEYNNVSIYKLDNIVDNSFDNKKIVESVLWDMEKITDDGLFVISDTLNRNIKTNVLSSEFSFSGKNSVKVMPNNYALGYFEDDFIANQKYIVRVKKYSKEPNNSNLIVCVSSPEEYYLGISASSRIDSSEWTLIEIPFRIPTGVKNKKLSIDFYNEGKTDVYLDDFSITKYEK